MHLLIVCLQIWAVATASASTALLVVVAVQLAPDHVPPQWPDPAHPQQLHLDVQVDDPDAAERQVLALGARRLPDPEGAEDFRVFADPAGHPFCLVFDA